MTDDDPLVLAYWSRLNAGLYWFRKANRAEFDIILGDVADAGGDPKKFVANVKDHDAMGMVVTEEREPPVRSLVCFQA